MNDMFNSFVIKLKNIACTIALLLSMTGVITISRQPYHSEVMECFDEVITEEIAQLIRTTKLKSSPIDILPSSLI